MGIRRQARELAMQVLFSMDMSCRFSKQAMADYCQSFPPEKRVFAFFNLLVNGVLDNKEALDDVIERYSNNWKIRRMACVDRKVLRLAVFEMLYCGDIPIKVSINEAIDIGKKFGSTESGAFINGILDSVRIAMENRELTIVDRVPTPAAASELINQ
jgi:N utilization substance protein B